MARKLSRSTIFRIFLGCITCLIGLSGLGVMPSAIAHRLEQSYLYFQISDTAISARAEVTIKDLNEVLELGFPADRKVKRDEIMPHLDEIKAYVGNHLEVACPPQNCDLEFQDHDFLNTGFAQFLLLNYTLSGFQTRPDSLQVTYDVILQQKPQNTNLVLIEENWQTGTFNNESNALFVIDQPGQVQTIDLTSGSLLQGFAGVVKLGVEHILEGIDHVLFLVALLLPSVLRRREQAAWQPVDRFSTSFFYIIKIATAFTIAHSITLCLATLNILQVPSRWVESIIAASIGLAAVEIFYPIFKQRAWLIIFLFGLFHGFGFADVLAELGITSQHAALSLFGFNLGVELGQLVIIAVIFPVLYLIRKQRFYLRYCLRGGGLLLGVMSLYWFIERAFNVNLQVLPFVQGLLGVLSQNWPGYPFKPDNASS